MAMYAWPAMPKHAPIWGLMMWLVTETVIFWIQTGIDRVWTGWGSKILNVQALLPIFCPRSYGHMRGRQNT